LSSLDGSFATSWTAKRFGIVASVYDREWKTNLGAHRDAATGRTGLLPISQTPGGDLYDLWREQSNFLGIVDEDAIGAIFLLDKCRQGI
jgi:hypothetical protein